MLLGKLGDRIAAVDTRLDGVLGVYVDDLTTGAKIEVRADEPFPTASSIKLASCTSSTARRRRGA